MVDIMSRRQLVIKLTSFVTILPFITTLVNAKTAGAYIVIKRKREREEREKEKRKKHEKLKK